MRKILNFGLIAILGVMTVMAPSCTKDLKDDVDNIKKQIETLAPTTLLDSKIKAVETQLATLESSINAEIKATKEKIAVIEGQIPTLATKKDLADLAARVTALETWKTEVTADLTAIKGDLIAIRAEYKAADAEIEAKIKAIESAHSNDVTTLKGLIADAVKESNEAREKLDEKLSLKDTELTSDIFRIDGQIETMLGDITIMKDQILANSAAITANAEAIAKKHADDFAQVNADILKNHNEYLAKVADHESRIGELEGQAILLRTDVDANKTQINEINDLIGNLKTGLETVQDDLVKATERLSTAEQNIATLQSDLTSEIANRKTAITDAINGLDLKIAQDIIDAIAEETTARTTAIENAIANLDFTQEISDAITAQATKTTQEITAAVTAETNARIEAIGAINAKLDGENGLIAKVDALKLEIEKHAGKLVTINADLDALKGRIQAINFISDYADGKATVNSIERNIYSDLVLRFRVYPANKAAELAQLFTTKPANFLLNLNSVLETRAAVETPELKIVSIVADPAKTGDIIVTACPNTAFKTSTEKTFSLSLDVVTEVKEGSTIALENTSSNVVAVHNNVIANTDIFYTDDETVVGTSVIDREVIPYNVLDRVVTIDTDFILGVFPNGKFTKSLADYGFHGHTTKMFTVKITVNGTATLYSLLNNGEITAAIAAAKAAGFSLNVADKKVQLDGAVKPTMIGNTIEMAVCLYSGSNPPVHVGTGDRNVIVEIGSIEVPVEYEAVEYTWAEDLASVNIMSFDLDKIATATGLTNAEVAAEFTTSKLVPSTEGNATKFNVINQSGAAVFNLNAKVATSWNNQDYEDVVLTKTLADKRKLKVTIKKISLKLPAVSIVKVNDRWSNDLSTMLVQGKYAKSPKVTGFKMDGDLTTGFETTPLVLPAGVKMAFEIVTADAAKWAMNADAKNIEIAKYDPETDNTRLKVNVFLVYTATSFNTTPIKVAASVGENKLVNVPVAPINPLLDITSTSDVTYNQANEGTTHDLDGLISLKDRVYGKELRQVSAATANNQTDYYVAFSGDATFDNSFKSYDVFGLSEGAAYTKGAIFTVGEMKYTDGTVVSDETRRSILAGFDATELGNAVLKYNYKGITLNKDVNVKINVKLFNFWGVSTGTISVKISKTI